MIIYEYISRAYIALPMILFTINQTVTVRSILLFQSCFTDFIVSPFVLSPCTVRTKTPSKRTKVKERGNKDVLDEEYIGPNANMYATVLYFAGIVLILII